MLPLSIVARLPLAMLSIGLLVHAQRLTGSFAAAGLVTAAYAASFGVGGPWLGRLVDRHGQTSVLLVAAACSAALLCAIALLPVGTHVAVSLRWRWAGPVDAAGGRLRAHAADRSEGVRPRGLRGRTGVGLRPAAGARRRRADLEPRGARGAGLVQFVATAAFASQSASRRGARRPWRARAAASLRTAAMRTLVGVLLAVGVCSVRLSRRGRRGRLAPCQRGDGAAAGCWGVGSLAGGMLAARRGTVQLPVMLARSPRAPGADLRGRNVFALAAALFFAGAPIAPTYAAV